MIDIKTLTFFCTAMNDLSLEEKTSTGIYVTRMSGEVNIDSILALDAEIIRLKRTRNSLLNVARIPPEILGRIFRSNVAEVGDPHFAEIQKGSYNFLLVCHHWFQVALHTSGLWTSWGNNLKDWKRWYLRSGISTLDLILDGWGYQGGSFDEALQDALRDRAARDVIRKVHFKGPDIELLTAVLSSVVPEGESAHPSSIESIVLSDVDVSNLFARRHFPKLRNLHLSGHFKVSSWDHLKSATTAFTNLSLNTAVPPSAIPTMSQILSLLASNPNLQSLKLSVMSINDDSRDGPKLRVSLRHLEHISLIGTPHHVFSILHQLEFPERMDHWEITLCECAPQEVLEVMGPHIRGYLQRDPRFRDRLGIFVSSAFNCILFDASVVGVGYHGPNRSPQHGPPYGKFKAILSQHVTRSARERLCFDVLALLPQESIVSFKTGLSVTEEVVVAMPNLEALHLVDPVILDGFLLPDPNGPNAHKKLLPSLRWLYLEDLDAMDDGCDPLVTYLAHQTSGNQVISLSVFGEGVHICSEAIEQIEGLVEELVYIPDPEKECPFE